MSYNAYYPYGTQLPNTGAWGERMKFTGHERDLGSTSSAADDLDYMHARHYNPQLGRFLSVDPVPLFGRAMRRPQGWNMYTYAASNPIAFIDPTGEYVVVPGARSAEEAAEELAILQGALVEAGADQEAATLKVEEVEGEFRITSGGADWSDSSNSTVKLIGGSIGTGTRIELTVSNEMDLSRFGGAVTDAVGGISRSHPDTLVIKINPSQVARTFVPGTFTAGPFAGVEGSLSVSPGTAAVHEMGHAREYWGFKVPRYGSSTNASALAAENAHRALMAKPKHTLRTNH